MRYLLLLSGLVGILFVFTANATIIHVPADYPTIQAGINASVNGDTVLVQPGTYHERVSFNGHNIALSSLYLITGDTAYISMTVIDGDSSGCVVSFVNDEDSTAILCGMTITNGNNFMGGGVYCYLADPMINSNLIINNSSNYGGGIYSIDSSPHISQNKIVNNRANSGSGGGIALVYDNQSKHPIIRDNLIIGNYAYENGGGISSAESWSQHDYSHEIINNRIIGNTARYGGGISFESGLCATYGTISGNIIQSNSAELSGGGLRLSNSHAIIYGNIFVANSCDEYGHGGGAVCYYVSLGTIFRNNSFISNTAGQGGGIFFHGGYPSVRNCLITLNTAVSVGGIYVFSDSLIMSNSIVWGNQAEYWRSFVVDYPQIDFCDIQDSTWAGLGNISAAPLFCDTSYGDFHLMSIACGDSADSPCIDAGDPSILDSLLDCSWGLGSSRSDMGAYGGGDSLIIGIDDPESEIPDKFMISQNYPNPFNAHTVIQYTLPRQSLVSIDIFDILGRKINTLAEGIKLAGEHQAIWDASGQASGIYFYRIKAGEFAESKKMVVLK